jgi:hypothetical protein
VILDLSTRFQETMTTTTATHRLDFQKDELSKRKAATRLDCVRFTIDQELDRAELYGL